MPPVLILLTLLLPLGAGAEEIIGGHMVKPHSRPYMVFLKSLTIDGLKKFCGGFLVQDNFVLTAAHCRNSTMVVILGAHNVNAVEKTQQVIRVERAITHPEYNSIEVSSDIMLLKLARKAKMTRAVSPLRLPEPNAQVKPGDVCRVAGWGVRSINSTVISSRLRETELIIQKDEECKCRFRHYFSTKEICAGDPKNKQTSFKGDSGGPLVCHNRAYGMVSFGLTAGTPPRVFTKISYFLPWIKRNLKLP